MKQKRIRIYKMKFIIHDLHFQRASSFIKKDVTYKCLNNKKSRKKLNSTEVNVLFLCLPLKIN